MSLKSAVENSCSPRTVEMICQLGPNGGEGIKTKNPDFKRNQGSYLGKK